METATPPSAGPATSRRWPWIVGIILLVGAIGGVAGFLLWPQDQDPSTVLPTREVALFLHGATTESRTPLFTMFPELRDAPGGSPESSLVLLKHDGKTEWMLFEPHHTRAEAVMEGSSTEYPWQVQSSLTDPTTAFVEEETLADFVPFSTLKDSAPEGPWAFIDGKRVLMGSISPLDAWMRAVIQQKPYMLVAQQDHGVHIAFYGDRTEAKGGFAPDLWPSTAEAIVSVSDPAHATAFLRQIFSTDSAVIFEGLARAWAQKWLGPSANVNDELLPLMHSPLTLSFTRQDARGPLLPFLAVSGKDDTDEKLEALATSFKNALPQGTVQSWKFENKFDAKILFPNTESIAEEQEDVNGTTMNVTATKDGQRAFVWALQGHDGLLSSSPELMRNVLTKKTGSGASTVSTHLAPTAMTIARGFVRVPLLKTFLEDTLGISTTSALFPESFTSQGTVEWRVDLQGNVTMLDLVLWP